MHADGTIDGEVTDTVPATLAAIFDGKFFVSCWAYPESLGQPANGYGVGVSGGQIADPEFSSAFCQPFAELKPTPAPTRSTR